MKPIDPRHAGQESDNAGAEPDAAAPDPVELVARARPGTTHRRRRKNVAQQPQPTEAGQESTPPEPAEDDAEDSGTFRIYAAFAYALIFLVESIDLWLT